MDGGVYSVQSTENIVCSKRGNDRTTACLAVYQVAVDKPNKSDSCCI